MTEQTDPQLIESFRNGDEKAFNLLVVRYQERVYWAARRILGSHEDADDTVQEVFLSVYRKLHSFRGDSEFFTWLYRITVNIALNASRKKKIAEFFPYRRPARSATGGRGTIRKASSSAGKSNPCSSRAISLLPEKQKAVFMMRYHEGMKFDAIASILRRSVGGVKSNYFHALRKIDRFIRERHA